MSCDHGWQYRCKLCGECYVCKHRAVHLSQEGVWVWKNSAGKLEPVTSTPNSFKYE